VSALTGLDLPGRAAALGLTCRQYLDLARADPRVAADPALEGGGLPRLRAWLAAGRPTANVNDLIFVGDVEIGAVVRAVVEKLPMPVLHHVVTSVVVIGSGTSTGGLCFDHPPTLPAPEGDHVHLIVLTRADEGLAAHECAHSWRNAPSPPRAPAAFRAALADDQCLCAALVKSDEQGARLAAAVIDHHLHEERDTDRLASMWLGRHVTQDVRHTARRERARIACAAALPTDEEKS